VRLGEIESADVPAGHETVIVNELGRIAAERSVVRAVSTATRARMRLSQFSVPNRDSRACVDRLEAQKHRLAETIAEHQRVPERVLTGPAGPLRNARSPSLNPGRQRLAD